MAPYWTPSVLFVISISSLAQCQQGPWQQCGGNGWQGRLDCVSGYTCVYLNDWYSQCQPGQAPPTTTSRSTLPPQPTLTTTTSSSGPTTTSSPPGSGVCTALPANPNISANSKLHSPFQFVNGDRVTSKAEWECRREEISELFQRYELGTFPPKPSSVTASFSGNRLTINASNGGTSISFAVTITYPSSGTAPYPAIIGYGGGSIPAPAGVAMINFNNDDMAAQAGQSSRGQGKFYQLYGSSHSASALTAWAWGVDRIIDALEITSGARIDPARVGVTGCSRNGKGAIVAGALVKRIALTIPQESGSGGSACWRLSDAQKAAGRNVQTASQIITENVWFSKSFEQYVNQISRLPVDHHLLAGMVAPRGLLVIENTSMEWLGNESTNGCMRAGRKIYEALGVRDNMAYSQFGHPNHCNFPSNQRPELDAFVQKFLLGNQNVNTNYLKSDGNFQFNEAQWIDWTTPSLL